MRTRFMKALVHELPGACFQSAVSQNRIHRPLHIFGRANVPLPRRTVTQSANTSIVRTTPQHWSRFVTVWRERDLRIPFSSSHPKGFFHSCTTGLITLVLLLLVGCKSASPQPP